MKCERERQRERRAGGRAAERQRHERGRAGGRAAERVNGRGHGRRGDRRHDRELRGDGALIRRPAGGPAGHGPRPGQPLGTDSLTLLVLLLNHQQDNQA